MKKDKAIILNDQNNFKNNKITPILSYFSFTTKYIFKKKSTFIFPVISFILVLLISLSITFFDLTQPWLTEQEQLKRNWDTFSLIWTIVISFSIVILGLFSSIKALNLFKDISTEGLEILIVSKPIERWQIIFVRFSYFLLLGIGLCLVNYFAALIGLLSLPSKFIPNSFSIFGNITIYFFATLLSYIFFGAISILLSLKFSTKLVTSFSSSIMGLGLIVSQTVPAMIPMIENGFYTKLDAYDSDPLIEEQTKYNFYLTNNKLVIYDSRKNVSVALTDHQKKWVEDSFKNRDDLSWITILNNFINPVAALTKISSNKPNFISKSGDKLEANFSDYNVSLNKGVEILHNEFDGNNHLLNLRDDDRSQGFTFEALNKLNTIEKIVLNLDYIEFNDLIEGDKLDKSFDQTLDYIFKNSNLDPKAIIDKIYENSKIFYDSPGFNLNLDRWIYYEDWETKAEYLEKLNLEDVKKQVIILSFYLYSLNKIDKNPSNFSTENKKLVFAKDNLFFGKNFKMVPSMNYGDQIETPLFMTALVTDSNYFTLSSKGEKASSAVVGASWSAIILVILVSTIIIYYRKDFV